MSAGQPPLEMPYPGLRPFEAEDQPLFFGREEQVNAMLRQLEDHHFVAVVGSSGSGKSSLVRAGVLPAVREGFLLGSIDWQILIIKPGNQPYRQLVRALCRTIRAPAIQDRVPADDDLLTAEETNTLASLRRTDRGLLVVLDEFAISNETRVMVVVDQFEELFAFRRANANRDTVASRDEAAAFAGMLLRSAAEPAGRIRVILTMRSDFIGDCEAFLGLPEQISRSQFLVPRPDRGQMTEAIARPATVEEGAFKTFTFEDGLVNRIINDAGDRPDQLPLMQHALMRTWKRAVERAGTDGSVGITAADYEQAGGIDKALSLHADSAWDEIRDEPGKAHLARRLFLLLCDISSDGQIARRRPKVAEIQAVTGASLAEIEQVVRVFQQDDRNFLLPPPTQPLSAETYLDISHEALLRQWRLFADDWLEQERRDASELRRLVELASLHQQGIGGLVPAQDLNRIDCWKEAVSAEWARRYVLPEAWDGALAFAEESKAEVMRQAAQKRRQARQKRAFLQAVAVVLLIATGVSTIAAVRAWKAEQKAKEQVYQALFSSARAGRFSRRAGQRFESLQALTQAARIRFEEQLRDEATVAMALPDLHPGPHWNQAAIWAVDGAYKFSAKSDGEGLITVCSVPGGLEIGRIESGRKTHSLVFGRDGRSLAQYSKTDGTWMVWRWADAHSVLGDPLPGGEGIAFSPDNHWVAIAQKDRIVRLDLDTGREINRWTVRGTVHSMALDRDGRQLAVGYENLPDISIHDAASGRSLADLPTGPAQAQVLAWHPDGVRLAIVSWDPSIQIWNVKTKLQVATLDGHVSRVTSLAFHPDGETFASQGWEGFCRIWDPSSGRQLLQIPALGTFGYSVDGRWIGGAGSGDQGTLMEATSLSEYRTIVSSRGARQGEYLDGATSPDGRLFAFAMKDGVRIWDPATWRELALLPVGRTDSVIFLPDSRALITCGEGGLLRWPIHASSASPDELRLGPSQAIPLPSTPTRARLSRDGGTLAVVCETGGGTFIVNPATGAMESELLPHHRAAFVGLSPDGRWMASSGWHSDRVRLWQAPDGTRDGKWTMVQELNPGNITRVTFTPDSRTLIVSRGQEIVFRDLGTREPSLRIENDLGGYPREIAFSPDGRLMAVALASSIVQLRETASGRIIAKLEDPNDDYITWMGFSADATRLLTSSDHAKTIHAWDLRAIRAQLKSMGLDWDWPEIPPSGEVRPLTGNPLRSIQIVSGD